MIFNSKKYDWGVRFQDGKPSREEAFDVLQVKVPVESTETEIEQFTIDFEEGDKTYLVLEWDIFKVRLELLN